MKYLPQGWVMDQGGKSLGQLFRGGLGEVCPYSKRWVRSTIDSKKVSNLLIKSTPSFMGRKTGTLYLSLCV